MATTAHPSPTSPSPERPAPVTFDMYRDIHKGIRAELFAVTARAGQLDPADDTGRHELAAKVAALASTLASHAAHEDGHIQEVIETHVPDLAARVTAEHHELDRRIAELPTAAASAASAAGPDRRQLGHELYIELASFTSAYLAHQDLEERDIMPALERAIGVEAVIALHGAIIASIPPEEMMQTLSIMLPAMNLDDRTELLTEMRATAPAEAFGAAWSLAGSVLEAKDAVALGERLGIG